MYTLTVTLPGTHDHDVILDELAGFHPAVSDHPRRHTEIILTVPAESLPTATRTGLALVRAAVDVEPVRVEALAAADFDRRVLAAPLPRLVSVTEAASALGVSRQAVLQRLDSGSLPGQKIGTTWVIPADAVEPA